MTSSRAKFNLPNPNLFYIESQIAAMEPDPVAAGASSSPPPSPAPATSPPWQTRDDDEPGAVDCTDTGGDLNLAPPPSPQQATVENIAVGSEVEQEEPKKEVMAGVGETLRSFMEEFGDQGEDSIILSPRLKEISTHDRPAALRFL
ncbi:hypothetical protein ZEAMMB73_Zm00001d018110, partial [Zea mays]